VHRGVLAAAAAGAAEAAEVAQTAAPMPRVRAEAEAIAARPMLRLNIASSEG
jgi:hypothetical protein